MILLLNHLSKQNKKIVINTTGTKQELLFFEDFYPVNLANMPILKNWLRKNRVKIDFFGRNCIILVHCILFAQSVTEVFKQGTKKLHLEAFFFENFCLLGCIYSGGIYGLYDSYWSISSGA